MRVIVTRPAREAARWVAALAQEGLEAVALPLVVIGPLPDVASLRAVWESLSRFHALMFVSANAVEYFFAQATPDQAAAWRSGSLPLRAWAPGPGTREALLAAGLPAHVVDAPPDDAAQFDSENLWREVAPQVGAASRVLLVRGGNGVGEGAGREWLSERLQAAGAQVEAVSAYARSAAVLDSQQLALACRAASDGSTWLFSSSEALLHLRAALPLQGWHEARAIATHPRIALALQDAGFGVVCRSRPAMGDILAALKSFR
jgi:uroporphyrinogen-III synthase